MIAIDCSETGYYSISQNKCEIADYLSKKEVLGYLNLLEYNPQFPKSQYD